MHPFLFNPLNLIKMDYDWTELNNSELNNLITDFLNTIIETDYELYAICNTMFLSGLRINEVLELNRWSYVNPDTFNIQLQKYDYVRYLSNTEYDPYIKDLIDNNAPYTFHNYASVNYSIKKHLGKIRFNSDSRPSTCHIFRYNFIKQLYDSSGDIAVVQDKIKHKSAETTSRYNNDLIYKGSPRY